MATGVSATGLKTFKLGVSGLLRERYDGGGFKDTGHYSLG